MMLPSTDSARAEGSLPGKAIVSPEALYQIVAGEAVILHLGTQCYYGLNHIGSRIWELLVEGASPESIVTRPVCPGSVVPLATGYWLLAASAKPR
jgi:hypothetical protein